MGGCQSNQAAAPLRRKGELPEAESKPYLVAEQKTGQFWVDPNELAAEESKPQASKKSASSQAKASAPAPPTPTSAPVSAQAPAPAPVAAPAQDPAPVAAPPRDPAPIPAQPQTPVKGLKNVSKLDEDQKNTQVCRSDATTPIEQKGEIKKPTAISKKSCPPYAVVYDDAKQDIRLVHWTTYEKKYLPGFLAEREKYLEKMQHQAALPAAKPQKPESDILLEPLSGAIIVTENDKLQVSSAADQISPSISKQEPSVSEQKLPPGPHTVVYDAENQYLRLISWDEYVLKYQQEDQLQWVCQKAHKAIPTQAVVENSIEEPVNTYEEVSNNFQVSSTVDQISLSNSKQEPVMSEQKLPPGPHTVVYDSENQYLQLISWDEYVLKYQQEDQLQWICQKAPKVIPTQAAVENLIEVPVDAHEPVAHQQPKMNGQAVVYDELSQSIKLISWDLYESEYLPKDLAIRKKTELARFFMHQQHQRKPQEPKVTVTKSFVALYDEEKQQVVLEDFATYKPTYKQDYALIYNTSEQCIDLIFWKDYLSNHEKEFRSHWTKTIRNDQQDNAFLVDPQTRHTASPDDLADHSIQNALDKEQKQDPIPNITTMQPGQGFTSDLTTIYDPVTEEIQLVHWDDYLKENKPPKQDWATEYDEKTKSVKLVFWKPYKGNEVPHSMPGTSELVSTNIYNQLTEGFELVNEEPKQDSAEQNDGKTVLAEALNLDLTTVYDPVTEGIKLLSWEDYLKANKPPKQDWTTEYDQKTQSVKLVFWKQYKENQEDTSINIPECPTCDVTTVIDEKTEGTQSHLTTVYDPVTEGIKLVTWDEYLKENKPPKQDWTTEYDEKSASVKLVFWKPYQVVQKTSPISSAKIETLNYNLTTLNDNLTTVYDPATEGIKLISWDDYLKANKPPKQDWATEYDPETESVKLVFWKQYQNVRESVTNSFAATRTADLNLTTVYDPATEGIKLVSLDDYAKENKLPRQDWATEFDEKSQSVKLVFWKQYEHVIAAPSSISKTPAHYTTVYDPLTQEVQLMDWDKYLEDHKPPKQDWAAEYDEKTQSVKLVFWKEYCNQTAVKSFSKESLMKDNQTTNKDNTDGFAAIYNEGEQSINLVNWDLYESDYLPDILCARKKKGIVEITNDVFTISESITM